MLLNLISDSELGHVIHFNNTDNSLYQANIGILILYIIFLKFDAKKDASVERKNAFINLTVSLSLCNIELSYSTVKFNRDILGNATHNTIMCSIRRHE